jgi:hypothetical protein
LLSSGDLSVAQFVYILVSLKPENASRRVNFTGTSWGANGTVQRHGRSSCADQQRVGSLAVEETDAFPDFTARRLLLAGLRWVADDEQNFDNFSKA